MGWAYGRQGKGQKYLQDFGWKIFWKDTTLNTGAYI